MAQNDATPGAQTKPPVRLRKPDRLQTMMSISCPDELVGKNHEVRTIAALVQTMDLSAFCEPIPFDVAQGEAREGNAGRDATDPAALSGVEGWCRCGYTPTSAGSGLRASWTASARRAGRSSGSAAA